MNNKVKNFELSIETFKGSGVFKVVGTSSCDVSHEIHDSCESVDWEKRFGHLDCFNSNRKVIE